MTMSRAGGLLDVLTSLSDCRQRTVGKDGTVFWGFRVCIGLDCGTNFTDVFSWACLCDVFVGFCVLGFCRLSS